MKIIKKIFKFIFSLLLIALLAGSGYIMYDYSQNPEKYDEFTQMFQDKITGKDKIAVEEVSPFVTPEMTLSLENSPYQNESFVFCEESDESKPVIMCYGKDMGGNLYISRNFHTLQSASLYAGPNVPERDISEFVTQNWEMKRIEVQEELLMELDPGEYYIVCYFLTEEGEGPYPAMIPLILEEETTFNTTQRGFVTYGDEFAWIVNDLEHSKEITLTFYNLGDNPIRTLLLSSEVGGSYLAAEVAPEDYEINDRGDTVTLKKEYLQRQTVNKYNRYAVRLANGDVLDMGWTVVGTVKGDSLKRLTISGPGTYSLSKGGDYVATYELNLCDSIYSCYLEYYPPYEEKITYFDEILAGENTGEYLDMESKTITIPEKIMKQLTPDSERTTDIGIGYFINNSWFDAGHKITVTE